MSSDKKGVSQVNDMFILQSKTLLQTHTAVSLSLGYWEKVLQIIPLSDSEVKKIFHCMFNKCKIMKFWDVNYKILSCILATPVVLAAVNPNGGGANCCFCGAQASLAHLFIHCIATKQLHTFVQNETHLSEISDKEWIFGCASPWILPLIWVVNFTVYKMHLRAFYSQKIPLICAFRNECYKYLAIYPVLKAFV